MWLCQVKIKAALVTLILRKGSATAETPLGTNQKGGKREDQHLAESCRWGASRREETPSRKKDKENNQNG